MRIGQNHLLVFALLPAFLFFSQGILPALKLFAAYALLFYLPGYVFASYLLEGCSPACRTIAGLFAGAAVLPQVVYYLSLFSSPVRYYTVLGLCAAFTIFAIWMDNRKESNTH